MLKGFLIVSMVGKDGEQLKLYALLVRVDIRLTALENGWYFAC